MGEGCAASRTNCVALISRDCGEPRAAPRIDAELARAGRKYRQPSRCGFGRRGVRLENQTEPRRGLKHVDQLRKSVRPFCVKAPIWELCIFPSCAALCGDL